mgnify:CR=1 FL=1
MCVALTFSITSFPLQNIKEIANTYYNIINASNKGVCVEFKGKTNKHWFSYIQMPRKYYQYFMIDLIDTYIILTVWVYDN